MDLLDDGERLGATHLGEGRTRFLVWAPQTTRVLLGLPDRELPLERRRDGYHVAGVDHAPPGTRYRFRLDGGDPLPDPASRHQPEGVHGPSAVVDHRFAWPERDWSGIDLPDHVLYEIHVGTFTPAGTLEAAIERLPHLRELGITAVELMPVAQFPGERNWGYDGVFPFAVQDSYGGPAAYASFVDAAHAEGLAVVQDVVHNHLGPEGNILPHYGPYFTDAYRTPWGDALNFDGPGSDEVRRYFLESALWFLEDLRVDALRLDAIHGIVDTTARPFFLELSEAVESLAARTGRRIYLFAETNTNDPRVVTPRHEGGLGIHGMWDDDFHHAIHSLATGEGDGYYVDFGTPEHVARAMAEGFVFTGQHSRHRGRRQGALFDRVPAWRLVVYAQNHDQIGNRPRGRRLSRLTTFEERKLAAGLVLLSPYLPLLFMGEEYGETAPFLYFVHHSDPELVQDVRLGRREEFADFDWRQEPPDPQDEGTFMRSKLDWSLREDEGHDVLLDLHRTLLRMRREDPALGHRSKDHQDVALQGDVMSVRRWDEQGRHEAMALFNLGHEPAAASAKGGSWRLRMDSAAVRWGGTGGGVPDAIADGHHIALDPNAFVVLARESG